MAYTLKATEAVDRFEIMKQDRGIWDTHFDELAKYGYPRRQDFSQTQTPGEKRMQFVYDSTPIHASELLAAGVHGLLTNPASEWFRYAVEDVDLSKDIQARRYVDENERITYKELYRPSVGFSTQMHEVYMEFVIFGTGVLLIVQNPLHDGLLFDAIPLSQCYIAENQNGHVDTLYREFPYTIRQCIQRWGKGCSDEVKKKYDAKKFDESIQILHCVQPSRDFYTKKKSRRGGYPACYIELAQKHKIADGQFHEFPYMVPRFYKASGETYGRSPFMTALPDVKMLNDMQRTVIRAAQKAIEPALLVPDQGVVSPIRTMAGGLTYYRAGGDKPEPLNTGTNVPLGIEVTNQVASRIREVMFNDQLQLREGPQMTATEVIQRTEERLRLMGPVLGRLQQEFLGPMLNRVHQILRRMGKFSKDVPASLQGSQPSFEYVSPVALSQKQLEAQGIMRAMEVLSPFVEMKPEILDAFDTDKMAQGVFDMFGVNGKYLLGEDEIRRLRENRAKAAAAEADAGNLREESGAMVNAAKALKTMGEAEAVSG